MSDKINIILNLESLASGLNVQALAGKSEIGKLEREVEILLDARARIMEIIREESGE